MIRTLILVGIIFGCFFASGFYRASSISDDEELKRRFQISETLKHADVNLVGGVTITCESGNRYAWNTEDNSVDQKNSNITSIRNWNPERPARDLLLPILFDPNLLSAVVAGAGGYSLKELVGLFAKSPRTQKSRVAFAIFGGVTGYYWGFQYGAGLETSCENIIRFVSSADDLTKDDLEVSLYLDSAERLLGARELLKELGVDHDPGNQLKLGVTNEGMLEFKNGHDFIAEATTALLQPPSKVDSEDLKRMELESRSLEAGIDDRIRLDNVVYRQFSYDDDEEVLDFIAKVATAGGFLMFLILSAAAEGFLRVKRAVFSSTRND